jgi:hypothetical protein
MSILIAIIAQCYGSTIGLLLWRHRPRYIICSVAYHHVKNEECRMRNKNETEPYSLPYTVRVGRASLIILFVLAVFISLLILSLIGRSLAALIPVVVLICIIWACIGVLMVFIATQRIVLLADRISYRKLFSQREMPFEDIVHVSLERVVSSGYRSRAIRYFLRIDDRFSNKPLLINTKPFSKRNLSIIIDALATHAPNVTLDESVRQLRDGTFRG